MSRKKKQVTGKKITLDDKRFVALGKNDEGMFCCLFMNDGKETVLGLSSEAMVALMTLAAPYIFRDFAVNVWTTEPPQ